MFICIYANAIKAETTFSPYFSRSFIIDCLQNTEKKITIILCLHWKKAFEVTIKWRDESWHNFFLNVYSKDIMDYLNSENCK